MRAVSAGLDGSSASRFRTVISTGLPAECFEVSLVPVSLLVDGERKLYEFHMVEAQDWK